MFTLLRPFVLFAAIAGLTVGAGLPVAPAQVKKDDKKTDPKDVKKDDKKTDAKDGIGVAEVYMAKDGWRFRIKNAEGKSIAIGTVGFEKKDEAMKALDAIKATLTKGKVVEIKEEKK